MRESFIIDSWFDYFIIAMVAVLLITAYVITDMLFHPIWVSHTRKGRGGEQ